MRDDVKKKWVEALRSGEYPQTKGYLHRTVADYIDGSPVGYCCLGVLCEVAVKEGVEVEVTRELDYVYYDQMSGALPDSVMEWAGLNSEDPVLERVTLVGEDRVVRLVSLSVLNDDYDADFTVIANAIEKGL